MASFLFWGAHIGKGRASSTKSPTPTPSACARMFPCPFLSFPDKQPCVESPISPLCARTSGGGRRRAAARSSFMLLVGYVLMLGAGHGAGCSSIERKRRLWISCAAPITFHDQANKHAAADPITRPPPQQHIGQARARPFLHRERLREPAPSVRFKGVVTPRRQLAPATRAAASLVTHREQGTARLAQGGSSPP